MHICYSHDGHALQLIYAILMSDPNPNANPIPNPNPYPDMGQMVVPPCATMHICYSHDETLDGLIHPFCTPVLNYARS